MLLAMDNTKLSTGMFGIGELNLSPIQSGPVPALKIPLVSNITPARGIAPATFARNSTATYIDANLVLQTAGIDVIRFQNGRYLCEPAATNMLSYSELLTSAYWLKNKLSVVEDTTKGSFKLTNTFTGECYIYTTNIISANGVYYTQSAVFEKGNTNFVSIAFANVFSPTLLPYAIFNLDAGSVSYTKNCVATITTLADNKFMCSCTALSFYDSGAPFGIITPSRDGAARITGVLGDYVYANKIQTETGTQATSYIPTTTSPVTRDADVLHYDVGDVITQGQGSLYCEFKYTGGTGVVSKVINLSNGTIAERITLYINTINGLQAIGVTGGVTTINTPTVTYAVSGNNKTLLTYRDNSVVVYHNGSLAGNDLSGLISRIFTKIHVGVGQDGLSQLNNEVGNIKYFKEVLTPAEAIKITTL